MLYFQQFYRKKLKISHSQLLNIVKLQYYLWWKINTDVEQHMTVTIQKQSYIF